MTKSSRRRKLASLLLTVLLLLSFLVSAATVAAQDEVTIVGTVTGYHSDGFIVNGNVCVMGHPISIEIGDQVEIRGTELLMFVPPSPPCSRIISPSYIRKIDGGTTQYTLRVTASGCGNTYPTEHTYNDGETATVEAVPCSGWKFDHWGGAASGSSTSTSVYMNSNKSVTAYFVREIRMYTLSLYVSPDGSGSVYAPDTGSFPEGFKATLTAKPGPGWTFNHWDGDASGTSTTVTITMDSNKSVTAYFVEEKTSYKLTTQTVPWEGGHIIRNPAGGPYVDGTSVALTVQIEEGYKLDHWEGVDSSDGVRATIVMKSDRSVTAYLKEKERTQYTLTIKTKGCGKTAPSEGTHTFYAGERVTVTAEESCDGWEFENWWGDAIDWKVTKTSSVTVIIDKNQTLEAIFGEKETEKKEFDLTIRSIEGGTTKPSTGTYSYKQGRQVKISATADKGWEFDRWEGAVSGTANPEYIVMDSDRNVTAYFKQQIPDLVVKSITWNPKIPIKGEKVTFKIELKNEGKGDATTFFYNFTYLGNVFIDRISGLKAGRSDTVGIVGIDAPQALSSGVAKFIVDSDNEIDESNEGNNVLVQYVEIKTTSEMEERIPKELMKKYENLAKARSKDYDDWANTVEKIMQGNYKVSIPGARTVKAAKDISHYITILAGGSKYATLFGGVTQLIGGLDTGMKYGEIIKSLVGKIQGVGRLGAYEGDDPAAPLQESLAKLSTLCDEESRQWKAKDFMALRTTLASEEGTLLDVKRAMGNWVEKATGNWDGGHLAWCADCQLLLGADCDECWKDSQPPEKKGGLALSLYAEIGGDLEDSEIGGDLKYIKALQKYLFEEGPIPGGDTFDELDEHFK